jgi:LysR family transcriptional regulator (chromosome initiation inhibitor)
MATAGFAARWFPHGGTAAALATAPVVVFDRRDDLQHGWLRARTDTSVDPPQHFVPSSADYVDAVRLGFGWGMVPDLQRTPEDDGHLVELDPGAGVDVVLHWQQWRLRSPSLDRVAAALLEAARRRLDQR